MAPSWWEPSMPNVVNGLFLRNGTVLLARRNPQRRAYPDLWSFPGGHVVKNETLNDALVRELREEVGVAPTKYTPLCSINDPNSGDSITYHVYAITAWEGGEPMMTGDEHTELGWFALDAA